MQRRTLITVTCCLAAIAAAWLWHPAPTAQPPSTAGGYTVHIDPATGHFVPASKDAVPVTLDPSIGGALSTSAEDLKEVPSPVDGGGIAVDLQGRFHHATIAVVDSSGELAAPCVTGLPAHVKEDGHE